MPSSLSPVTHLFSRLLSSKVASLDSLPNDILVDCIFIHLGVRDILHLRRVSMEHIVRLTFTGANPYSTL